MKYQLVLQLPCRSSIEDYDYLIELEEAIMEGLGDMGIVDGHDYGAGEMNVFIHTDEPATAFEKVRSILNGRSGLEQLKAGYRDFDEDDYIAIYPIGLEQFTVA
jgi:hypothetical protein